MATNGAAAAPARQPPITVSADAFQALRDESVAWMLGHFVQIAIAGAIATLLVALMLGLRALATRMCRRLDWHTHWPVTIGRVIAQTRVWFMVFFAAKLVDGYADPPVLVAQTINVLFTIAAALQGAFWVREMILGVIEHRAGASAHGHLGSAIGIIRLLVTVVLFAVAIVLILDNLGVNVTGLIAGLGIGGIAIGLAAKGIFDDLFSALSIIFDRPFQTGDSIRWDKTTGTVEAIGLKTTRVRAVTGEEVVISNTNLLGKELHNLARLQRRRIVMTIGVAYYTPPDVCASLPARIKAIVEGHALCTLVRCGLVTLGASTLDFELQFDVGSDNYDVVFEARHDILCRLLEEFAREGIDLPFPTQINVEASPEGRPIDPRPVRAALPGTPGAAIGNDAAVRAEVAPD